MKKYMYTLLLLLFVIRCYCCCPFSTDLISFLTQSQYTYYTPWCRGGTTPTTATWIALLNVQILRRTRTSQGDIIKKSEKVLN